MSEPKDSTQPNTEPRPLVERTIDRWTGNAASNGRTPLGEDSAESKGNRDSQHGPRSVGRRGAGAILTAVRFVLGTASPAKSEPPTRWSDYLVDFVLWAVILASLGALVYLLYHGLEMYGFIQIR